MNTWDNFYADRVNNVDYFKYFSKKYAVLLDLLHVGTEARHEKGEDPITFIEIGCGLANTTKWLIENNIGIQDNHICVDNNETMIELARRNLSTTYGNTKLVLADIHSESFFNVVFSNLGQDDMSGLVVHSHGVLEHFTDTQIVSIVQRIKKLDIMQIHYVPSNLYGTPSFGDERLLTKKHWQNLLPYADIYQSNNGKDLYIAII